MTFPEADSPSAVVLFSQQKHLSTKLKFTNMIYSPTNMSVSTNGQTL